MTEVKVPEISLLFKVTKQQPCLIPPLEATPYEFKDLSEIDNQQRLRFLEPAIHFYRAGPVDGPDPVKVIKKALGKALVAYYPFAGRLREKGDGKKLVIECNGEGIIFVEANADVSLVDFGEPILPPFPCNEELYCETSDSVNLLEYPILSIQLTRLKCGGFIFAYKFNHIVADGPGVCQFMRAAAELARGAESLSLPPVWDRHLLCARNPPQITHAHREYDDDIDNIVNTSLAFNDVVHKFFFFGPTEIGRLRCLLPAHLKSSTTFEIVTGCIWRSRTIALQFTLEDEIRFMFIINARHVVHPPIPAGYYGNVTVTPVAITIVRDLISNPLEYTVDLIRRVKQHTITPEYVKSLVDFLATNKMAQFHNGAYTYYVADISRLEIHMCDFGWGNAVYGEAGEVWFGSQTTGFGNYYLNGKNEKGETGILVPISLPRLAMGRFVEELNGYLNRSSSEPPKSLDGYSKM